MIRTTLHGIASRLSVNEAMTTPVLSEKIKMAFISIEGITEVSMDNKPPFHCPYLTQGDLVLNLFFGGNKDTQYLFF